MVQIPSLKKLSPFSFNFSGSEVADLDVDKDVTHCMEDGNQSRKHV